MPLCAECDENLPRDCFSGSQLKRKSGAARCKQCVSANPDNDRRLGVLPPNATDNGALPKDLDKDQKDMTSDERIAVLKAGMAAFGLDDDFITPELRATMSEIFESVASGSCHESIQFLTSAAKQSKSSVRVSN